MNNLSYLFDFVVDFGGGGQIGEGGLRILCVVVVAKAILLLCAKGLMAHKCLHIVDGAKIREECGCLF